MKAIAINGSPRPGGNTEILLERALDRLRAGGIECEQVRVGGKNIRGCIACGWCHEHKNGKCAIQDDCFQETFDKMKNADIIITGSPVYFGSATPELMALLDRAGYVGRPIGTFTRKIGGPVTVARRAGQNFTYAQLMFWFMINDFIMPGSSYWNVAFGRLKKEVLEDEEGLETVDRFGDNLLYLAQKLGPDRL